LTSKLCKGLIEGYLKQTDNVTALIADIIHYSVQAFAFGYGDGRFLYFNKAFRELTGYSKEELRDMSWVLDLTPREWRTCDVKVFQDLQRTGLPQRYEKEYLRKDKKILPIDFIIHKIHNNQANEPYYYFFVTDISQRKDVEKELKLHNDILINSNKELTNEIAQLDRLNLMGQMAGGIGHEVRNPMTTVRGFLQMLCEKDKFDEEKDIFNLMIEELDRANDIITQFLSLAQSDPDSKLINTDLNHIIKSIYPLILSDATKVDVNLILKLEKLPILLLDEKEIRQVILNLVRNGLESMQLGGNLSIRTFRERKNVVLGISDEGKGIPQEILANLGTPFVTTKEKGTGLGLSICYSIAKRHNAKIEVESSSKGTTFYVKFNLPKKSKEVE